MHLITSSRIDGKCVWVFVSDVSVAVLLIAHRNLMACRNIHFGVSAEEANIEDPLEFPGSEHAKRLFLHSVVSLVAIQLGNFMFQLSHRQIISSN